MSGSNQDTLLALPSSGSAIPSLSSVRQYTQQHITVKKRKHEPTEAIVVVQATVKSTWAWQKTPLPMNAYELENEPMPEGGVTAKLNVRMPRRVCLSFGQLGLGGRRFTTVREARKALYQEAFDSGLVRVIQSHSSMSPPEQANSSLARNPLAEVTNRTLAGRSHGNSSKLPSPVLPVEDPAPIPRPQPSAEFLQRRLLFSGPSIIQPVKSHQASLAGAAFNSAVAGKKRSAPEDGRAGSRSNKRKELHGRTYRSMLSFHCIQSGLSQPAVTHRRRIVEGESAGPPVYDVSALVGTEEFHLPISYESVEVAEEKLSKVILKSFGIHPKKE